MFQHFVTIKKMGAQAAPLIVSEAKIGMQLPACQSHGAANMNKSTDLQ